MTDEGVGGGLVSATVAQHDGVAVASLSGELDLSNAAALRTVLEELVAADESPLVVDLGAVTFMDSTALGVLVRIRKVVRAAGRPFGVACPAGPVLRLLTITGLADVFDVRDTLDSALAAVKDA